MTQQDTESPVLSDISDGVMTITLNRPDRGNGWTGPMSRSYFAMLDQAARSPDVRAIIVTGAGKAFCVGGDSEVLDGIAGGDGIPQQDSAPVTPAEHWFPLSVGKPIVAAVNGACFGIGMQQVLCCDIRFASEDAKFSTAFARRGLAAEMGITWLLPRLVGTGHAADLLMSARLVRAAEAERMGLVNRVVPAEKLMEETRAYALDLADKCAPSAMRTIKQQMWHDLTARLPESYENADRLMQASFSGDDFKEGMRSWQENRSPQFPPLPDELALIPLEGDR